MKLSAIIVAVALVSQATADDYVGGKDCPKYEWYHANDNQEVLLKNGLTVGQWYRPDDAYYPWDGHRVLPSVKPPIDPPGDGTQAVVPIEQWQTRGVDNSKMGCKVGGSLTMAGKKIDKKHLAAAFDGTLTDDSTKGYLVVISKDKAKRDAVLADWLKLPVNFTSRYNVWMASPDHFTMQDRFSGKPRFFSEGDPTVVLEKASGEVLFRRPQSEQRYSSTDMQELLKSDPDYKPELDPGAPSTSGHYVYAAVKVVVDFVKSQPPAVLVSVAITLFCVVVLLIRRKK